MCLYHEKLVYKGSILNLVWNIYTEVKKKTCSGECDGVFTDLNTLVFILWK